MAASFHETRRRVLGLYFDGRYGEALAEVEREWVRFPAREPTAYFFRMCLWSRLGEPERALELFDEALAKGIWWDPAQLDDADLDPARTRPGWEARLAECRRLQAATGPPPPPIRLDPVGPPAGTLVLLHGRGAAPAEHVQEWDCAVAAGWAVVAPYGTLPMAHQRWGWDPDAAPAQLAEALPGLLASRADLPVALAGFSQGAALAARLAYQGTVAAAGVIAVGPAFDDFGAPWPGSPELRRLPTYAVFGEHDHERAAALVVLDRLGAAGWPVTVEDAPGAYHEYPEDFGPYFRRAVEFLRAVVAPGP